ncbi:MAG: c-type cytochrome biogenesis protein CcmI [Alphaproteobacteria bacterium]
MTSWLVFFAIAAVAALVVAMPSLRRLGGVEQRDAFDLEVFRRQLSEVDADLARGVLDETEAVAARLEIERRILTLADTKVPKKAPPAPLWRGLGVGLILVVIPGLSLLIYSSIGAPGAPDRPLAARADEAPTAMPGDVDEMITKLAAKLEEDPDNLEGWMLLGRSFAFMERYQDAATAFASAAALAPDDDDIVISYGEALTYAAGGAIPPAARQQFTTVLGRNPDHEGARYFSGMMQAQDGDLPAALATWSALAQAADPTAPWLPGLVEQLRSLAAEIGVEAPDIAVADAPPPVPATKSAAPGPDAADIAMAAEMSPGEQADMINSMVARLEARLIDEPNDVDGWKRLGKAKRVLENLPGARDAYANAVERAPDDVEALGGLAEVEMLLGDPAAPLPEQAVALYQRILALNARQPDALWFLGLAAKQAGRPGDAGALWTKLLDMLPPGSDEHAKLSGRIAELATAE